MQVEEVGGEEELGGGGAEGAVGVRARDQVQGWGGGVDGVERGVLACCGSVC